MSEKPLYKAQAGIEPVAIVAMPCVEAMKIGYVPYKNSEVRPCSHCETACFVGPESLKLHETSGVAIACPICLAKEYGMQAVLEMMQPLTNKQLGE